LCDFFWFLLWCWSLTRRSGVGAVVVSVVDYQRTVGITMTGLRTQLPSVRSVSNSFLLLVSKGLAPYRIPPEHSFLRLGNAYVVFEIKDDRVLAVHRVSG